LPPYVDELESWYRAYSEGGGRRQVSVEFTLAADRGGAYIDADGVAAMGRMEVWEEGWCDTGALAIRDGSQLFWRHRELTDPASVAPIADDLIDYVAGYSERSRVERAIGWLKGWRKQRRASHEPEPLAGDEPVAFPRDMPFLLARWQLFDLPSAELTEIATALLEQGHETPALHMIAGSPAFVLGSDADRLLDEALFELGISIPTEPEAARLLVREAARQIVDGEVTPYSGARAMLTFGSRLTDDEDDELALMRVYVGEVEAYPRQRAKYDADITNEAQRFIQPSAD
jgi:hypothetical protein